MSVESSNPNNNVVPFEGFRQRQQIRQMARLMGESEFPLYVIDDETTDKIPAREDGAFVLLQKYPDRIRVDVHGIAAHTYSDKEVNAIGEYSLMINADDVERGDDNYETGINNIRFRYHMMPAQFIRDMRLFEQELLLMQSLPR